MPLDLYRRFVRPLASSLDADTAHRLMVAGGRGLGWLAELGSLLGRDPWGSSDRLRLEVCGLTFPNPIGLAAGLDTDAEMVPLLTRLGFGLVEVGSVSRHASGGNLRRRVFHLPKDEAIVVPEALPSRGAEDVARRLTGARWPVPLGVNLVPTHTDQPRYLADIGTDLAGAAAAVRDRCQYLTLNFIRPGAPIGWGRGFVSRMVALTACLKQMAEAGPLPPVFVKLPPVIDTTHIEATLDRCDPFPFVRGFIFSLPDKRDYPLKTSVAVIDRIPGAISGPHTRAFFDNALRTWFPYVQGTRFILVGGGGVFTAEDAYRKIRCGASLVQVYTALVYRGPALVRELVRGLAELLRRDGFENVRDAIGVDGAEKKTNPPTEDRPYRPPSR